MNNETVEKNKKEIVQIIENTIDKGANYIIRSMPVNKHIKEILINIKQVLKEGDFSSMIKVALISSINEAKGYLNDKNSDLNNIEKMVNMAFDGGITSSINIGIDMIENTNKYGNLFCNYIEDFFVKLKGFISSKEFKSKVYLGVSKCLNKVDNFKKICDDWYNAYDNFNIESIKEIANKLNKMKKKVSFDTNCINENSMIQNVTELVSRNKKKLTSTQFAICAEVEKI